MFARSLMAGVACEGLVRKKSTIHLRLWGLWPAIILATSFTARGAFAQDEVVEPPPEKPGDGPGAEGEVEPEQDPPEPAPPEGATDSQDEEVSDESPAKESDPESLPNTAAPSPEEREPAQVPEERPVEPKAAPAPEEEFPDEAELADDDEEYEFEAVAEVEAPPREPTRRTMDKEQLTRIPGTRGDALRSIEIMPGVARTEFASNDGPPMIRGSGPYESLVLLNGAQVPLIYHFGGLTSFFNSHLLETVNMYPGNYSARYGRAAGGVVEAKVRDPRDDGFHALVELSAIDSFAVVEAPVAKKTAVALAARRSNIDFFFDAFVPEDAYNVLAAPVYWDFQAIVAHRFDEKNKLRLMSYGSEDKLKLQFGDSAPDDPALRGGVGAKMGFHRLQAELESQFSETVAQKVMVSAGPSFADQTIGQLSSKMRFWDVNARAEWSIFASDALRFDTGLDFTMFAGTGAYTGPAPAPDEGDPGGSSLASENYITIEEKGLTPIRPAAYFEASIRPIDEWLIVPGVRADYIADGEDWIVDPRLSTRIDVTESTTLKGGLGVYSQPPEYYEIMDDLGNPDAKPFRTVQSSGGVEQKIGEHVKVDVEGFYKRWHDRLVGTDGGAPPRFVNDGRGKAYGLETLLDVRLSGKTQAFLAYTLSRSERQDRDDPWRLFDYDQTHNLSLTANYDFGHGWLAGARFRYVTGNPISKVEGTVYDASTDTYRALFGEVNGDRNPAFHQLDVRVEKRWDIGRFGLTSFLEVLNVYNAQNEEGQDYSFDYSESQGYTGMPIFPNLGIRGEL